MKLRISEVVQAWLTLAGMALVGIPAILSVVCYLIFQLVTFIAAQFR